MLTISPMEYSWDEGESWHQCSEICYQEGSLNEGAPPYKYRETSIGALFYGGLLLDGVGVALFKVRRSWNI